MESATSRARCVVLDSVTKQFGELTAVDAIDLDIAEGEFFTMLGPSGCGKTTTLRMIAGFEEVTAGRLAIDDEDMLGIPPHKRPTNTVFQSYALFPTSPSRRTSLKSFILVGVAPFLGGAMLTFIFVKAFLDYKTTSTDVNYSGGFLGVGTPVAIGVGGLLIGVVVLVFANFAYPKFFKRKWETADPGHPRGDRQGRGVRDVGLTEAAR